MTTFYLDPEGGDDFGSDFSVFGRVPTLTSVASTTVAKYGANSLDFSGSTASRLSVAVSAGGGLQIGASKFTAEAWVYFTSHSATTVETMFGQWTDGGASALSWRVGMNASGQLQYQWSTSGTASAGTLTSAFTPTLNTWYHVAVDKDGTTTRLYLGGVVVASVADTSTLAASTGNFVLGNDNAATKRFPGYMQDFRLTVGAARYAGTFTPPAAALPITGNGDTHFNNVMLLVPGRGSGSGTSFANRWRTVVNGATAARTAPGDTIRLRATPDPSSVGNATWTQNSKTVTLATAVTANIDACDVNWTPWTSVTTSLSSTSARREGADYLSVAVASAFTTGKVAYHATGTLNLSGYQQVSLWFQANATQLAGSLRLVLCSDTTGDTALQSIYLPDYPAVNQWQAMVIDTGAALPSSVASVALYADVDPGTVTILLDNIFASKASSSADSLTLRSLIGKIHNLSWAASTTYAVNDRRRPTQANRNGFAYQVTALTGAAGAHRYWRLLVNAASVSTVGVEIEEVALYATVGGSNIVTGGTASADSEFLPAANAFDGTTSIWAPNPGSFPHWVAYDFGSGNDKAVLQYGVQAATDSNYNPKDFKLQYSDDASTWADADTRTGESGWASNELRKYTLASPASGSSEPTWPAAWGRTVTDGTLVWTCIDRELEDSWFPLTGVNGTTLTLANSNSDSFTTLRGYHGATETVATYKREAAPLYPVPANFNPSNTINEGGSSGSPITYSGGWNRTDMSAQDGGETWWDNANGNGHGLHVGNNKFLAIAWFNAVRAGAGIGMSSGAQATLTNCHMNGNTNGFDLTATTSQWTLNGVHGFNNSQAGVSCSNAGEVFGKAIQGCNNGAGISNTVGFQLGLYKVRTSYVVARNNSGVGIGAPVSSAQDAIVANYATSGNGTSVAGGIGFSPICFVNGVCGEATFVTQSNLGSNQASDGYLYSHKHGGDVTDHRVYFAEGTVRSDASTRHTASGLAWKCSLTSTFRTPSYPVRFSLGRYLLQANVSKTFKVWSRRDLTSMKGALFIHAGALPGIDSDASASVDPSSLNTWEQAAGLTVTPTETGVIELWMLWWDGAGTTGNYWIDDLTVT